MSAPDDSYTDEHSAPAMHFTPQDLVQFDEDDTEAGRNIGKMLSLFFLYTIMVMSLAGWWTYRSIAAH